MIKAALINKSYVGGEATTYSVVADDEAVQGDDSPSEERYRYAAVDSAYLDEESTGDYGGLWNDSVVQDYGALYSDNILNNERNKLQNPNSTDKRGCE